MMHSKVGCPKPYQAAMLRYCFVDETRTVYESLKLSEEDNKDPEKIVEAMGTFPKRIVNETLERHTFNSRNQQKGEVFDDFITEIITLSKDCNFCERSYSGRIRDRIVNGVIDDELRRKLLSEKDLTEQKAKEICRAYEKALQGAEVLSKRDKVSEDVISEAVDRAAMDALYFSEITVVDEMETREEPKLELEVNTPKGKPIIFKIDTGANVSVIGLTHLELFGLKLKDLKPTRKKLMGADNRRMTCKGYFCTKQVTQSRHSFMFVDKLVVHYWEKGYVWI